MQEGNITGVTLKGMKTCDSIREGYSVHYKKRVVWEQDTYTITWINLHDIRKLESHSFATTLLDKRVQGALCLFVDWVLSKQYSHKIYQKKSQI